MATKETKEVLELVDGKEVYLYMPSPHQTSQSNVVYNQAWKNAAETKGLMLRKELETFMKQRGLWSDEKNDELITLTKDIRELTRKLKGGAKYFSGLKAARDAAFDIKKKRARIRELLIERNELDNHTAEAYAEREKLDFLISECVLDSNGKRYFKDMFDYQERAEEPNSFLIANKLANMIYGLVDNFEMTHGESQFLLKYGFVDKDGNLINKDGQMIDEEGRLINKDGRFINKDGAFVDVEGNLIDEKGEYIEEFVPFVDEDGKEIKPVD